MSQLMPTVFVVDPSASVRAALDLLLHRSGWTARTFESAGEFLTCPRSLAPSCLLIDVALPDHEPVELLRRIAAERPETQMIGMSAVGDIPMAVRVMKAGVLEFLTKPLVHDILIAAVGHALTCSRRMLDEEADLRDLRERHDSLSGREQQVMARVVTGLLNKQIAAVLGISEITVKAHRGKVMRKMGADSLAQLVSMALRLRLTPERVIQPTAFSFAMGATSGATSLARRPRLAAMGMAALLSV